MPDHPTLVELSAYRDFLTELILRGDRTFLQGFGMKPFATLKSGYAEFSGVNFVGFGVGVGLEKDESAPALYVFLDPSTKERASLLDDMSKSFGLPIRYQKAQFIAAARPVEGGHSMGHGSASGETGTMGCVVKNKAGDRFGLSCNHVIADCNNAVCGTTDVWSPGSSDGGTSSDLLGVVHAYLPLAFGGAYNDVDAALAKPHSQSDLDPAIAGIGAVQGWTSSINFGDAVQKSGAATKVTNGKYRFSGISGLIKFPNGSTALFQNLMGIIGTSNNSDFATNGDSGAVVVNDRKEIVGQVISVTAGVDLTLASPIGPVLKQLNVEPV
jgi:hypothetical protein